MKTFKLLTLSLSLLAVLTACSSSPNPSTNQILVDSIAAIIPTQARIHTSSPATQSSAVYTHTPTSAEPQASTAFPANTPVWSTYYYTCELASGGANMTMNLFWYDRSGNEQGYIVYRNKLPIAALPTNSTSYVDTAFVASGQTLSYAVEAFNPSWRASTSTITNGCQVSDRN